MKTQIQTLNDVIAFAKHLVQNEKLSFHPDDDFRDYVKFETQEAFYTQEEALYRNKLMDKCVKVCKREKIEIYEVMLPIIHEATFA
jgi:hypothetical protein